MRYTFQKLLAVLQGLGVGLALTFLGMPITPWERALGFNLSILALLIGAIVCFFGWRRAHRFQTLNYGWYRRQYPNHVRTNSVHCRECNGTHIRVRGLMRHSYTREHFCAHCGTTLYYSPE